MRPSQRAKLAIAVTVSAIVGSVLAPAAAFDDVPAGAFYEDAVEWMAEQGITTGKTPTIFDPLAPVTRGESATFIWRFGSRPEGSSNPFVDVPEGAFYTEAVKWMKDTGITTGKSPTIFDPSGEVTRGELATFLWRYMCKPMGSANPFVDVPEGTFFTEAVKWMVDEGITTGKSPTIFDPYASVTRGELATFVWRLAGKPPSHEAGDHRVSLQPKCDGTPPPPPAGVGSLSVSPTSFALGDIDVAVPTEVTLSVTNAGGAGGPALAITEFDLDDTDVTTSQGVLALDPGESRDVTITVTPASLGADSATLTIRHAGSNGPSTAVPISWTAGPHQVHKINAGGPAVGSWTADSEASPSPLHNVGANRIFKTTDPISGNGSVPDAVYQTSRFDRKASPDMEWDLPVPNPGRYLVRLHFAEVDGSPERQNIEIEGDLVLDNFDVGDEAGGTKKALVRSFIVTADDDVDLDFRHVYKLDDTHVAGIEVIGLGQAPPGYLVASPSRADLGSVRVGVDTNTVRISVTNLGSTSVTIPSIPGTVGDFDPSVGSLVIPGGATRSFDVDFATSDVGVQSAWLPLTHPKDPAFGVHLRGHGGATATASVEVLAEKFDEDASVFSAGTIAIRNNAVSANITKVKIELGGALLDGLEFDVDDGVPISGGEKGFTADFGEVTVVSSTSSDGSSAVANFSGFGPGETLHASIDIDPLSSFGMIGADHARTGPISGLEMVGALITVTFAGGTTVSGPLWTDGYPAGGVVVLEPGVAPAAPTIGFTPGVGADGTIDVICPTNGPVALVQIHAERDMTGASGAAPLPTGGNRLLEIVLPAAEGTQHTGSCVGGVASFPVTLVDTLAANAKDGYNQFMVRRGALGAPGSVSAPLVVHYES